MYMIVNHNTLGSFSITGGIFSGYRRIDNIGMLRNKSNKMEDAMKRQLFTNKAIWAIIGQLLLFSLQPVYAGDNEFRLVGPVSAYSSSHRGHLGINPASTADGSMQYWIRDRDSRHPGDYFLRPHGADSTSLTDTEFSEIESLLRQNVYDSYYDDLVLESLSGHEYTFADSAVWRREYYVRYARGDTIYVISGWLGKFLSFYRAVPADFRYDIDELQNQVKLLSPSYRKAKEKSFKQIDQEINYFLEYVDKQNKMRVRNYQINAGFRYGVSGDRGKKYNIIEITKFIDPEVMP